MNELSVKLVLNRILLKQSEGESELVGGLIIPDSEKVKPAKGVVVAVGPGFQNQTTGEYVPMSVKVGDNVVYDIHGATTVDVRGTDYIFIKEGDLLVIL
jgi:chaperonin GroES